MHILIVEDDHVARTAMERLIESLGHTTCWAASGESAVKSMRTEKPELIILDMLLGEGMSGWDVAREKVLDDKLRSIPLIIVSGVSAVDVRNEARVMTDALAGAMLILSKPVDAAILEHAIASLAQK
jgi:CheY-like chemotaxis protein